MNTLIGKEYKFEAGHHLWDKEMGAEQNRQVFGKCVNPHGHSYTFVVEIGGPVKDGMVMNYYAIDDLVDPIAKYLDHTILNELPEFRGVLTTAENIAAYIFALVRDKVLEIQNVVHPQVWLNSVTVRETVKTFARVEA